MVSDAANTHMSSPAWIQCLSCSIELLNYFWFTLVLRNCNDKQTRNFHRELKYLPCLYLDIAKSLEVYHKMFLFVTPTKEVDTAQFNG